MDSIGDTLRRERLRRGLELEYLAAQTKIGQYYLQAMEENQFDRLPGGLFTRSFVRQYTNALDLNEEEVITQFKQQFEEPAVPLPAPQNRDRIAYLPHVPMFAWFVVAITACGAVYSYWENLRHRPLDRSTLVLQHPVHERRANLNRRASLETSAKPLEPEVRSLEEPPIPRSAAGKLGPEPSVAPLRVVFAATEPVWVSVKTDGINAYSGTLEGQQSREFEASTKMTALVGNAGGLAISMNGRPIALRGAHGEIQSLVLTPSGVHVVPRATPPTSPTQDSAPLDERQPPADPSGIVTPHPNVNQ